MRKIVLVGFVMLGMCFLGFSELVAQDAAADEGGVFQMLKEKFIEGDWFFMSFVLITLILGLAFCIERIITLNIATTNTSKLLNSIDEKLGEGDLEGAKDIIGSHLSEAIQYRSLDREGWLG